MCGNHNSSSPILKVWLEELMAKTITFDGNFNIMDISAQIKNSLIARIAASTDLNFLKALQTIFDSSEQSLFELTPE